MKIKGSLLAGVGMMSLLVAIVLNAVSWQDGRHPAPLIATKASRSAGADWFAQSSYRPGRPSSGRVQHVIPKPRPDPVVSAVQSELARLKIYSEDVDGLFGPKTRDAIRAYQKIHGMREDGKATDRLLDHIRFNKHIAEAAKTPLPAVGADPRVKLVQSGLSELGYSPGPVDGHMGEQTREAIRNFERDRRLPKTGEISDRLVEELRKVTGTSVLTAG